jgi:selenium-binding protein 1
MFTSSFTGWTNFMMDFGTMLSDGEAMKRFGNTAVMWDLHTRKPKKVFDMPGAPLEIRCAWKPNNNYCFTSTALTSQIWLMYEDASGEWQAQAVGDIGDPSKIPLPVDISITSMIMDCGCKLSWMVRLATLIFQIPLLPNRFMKKSSDRK